MKMNRRTFVSASVGGAAGAALSSGSSRGGARGANERVTVACIGCGGMGRANLNDFLRMDDVQVAAVCDVWEHNRQRSVQMTGGEAASFGDFRRVLELQNVDAVIVATPDHWHAPIAIAACEAGKDVYVEKPLALTIAEGRQMVEAARRHGRVVQVGTQQRSGVHYREVVELVRGGALGTVSRVACWNFGNSSPAGIGNPPDGDPPPGLDWDMYLGPAPRVPFNPNRFINTFRWFWDYSGGKVTDWGTHHLDVIQWAMDVEGPQAVTATGGKFVLEDNRETPDTLEVVFEYPDFIATFSHREVNGYAPDGRGYGIQFYGSDGTLFVDRDGYELIPEAEGHFEEPTAAYLEQMQAALDPLPPWQRERETPRSRTQYVKGARSEQHIGHVRNFLDCVKSRQRPRSDVETGHTSTAAPHLANIALHTGRRIRWDAGLEEILDDPEAAARLGYEYREWERGRAG